MRERRLFIPEVVQTSAMDCGPACLTAMLQGFGIPASYDRMREACQTDLDGASIDSIEQMAIEMGLDAEQVMVPVDHLLAPEANLLPALIVVRLPNSTTHFLVVWKRYGSQLQVMDPAEGRQWLNAKTFLDQVHIHEQMVPADGWREWAGSQEFLGVLRRRALGLGVSRRITSGLIKRAIASPSWEGVGSLDAAIRMLAPLAESGGLRGSRVTARVLEQFLEQARTSQPFAKIPPESWSVLPVSGAEEEGPQLLFRGAVVLRVRGRKSARSCVTEEAQAEPEQKIALPQSVRQAPVRTMRELLRILQADGLLTMGALMAALILAAAGVVVEALLYRTFLDLTGTVGLTGQRLAAVTMLLSFLVVLIALDRLSLTGLLRAGRKLEARLRAHILYALPRLPDRYFGSRLVSDMAERSHAIHEIRGLPVFGGELVRNVSQLIITTLAIIWLDARDITLILACMVLAVAWPLVMQPTLAERDLRFRTHAGGLCRFYFDALRGLVPVRAHGAADAIRREHENLLSSWLRAGIDLQRAAVALHGAGLLVSFGLVASIVIRHLTRNQDFAGTLLLVYWTLNLPVLGDQIAQLARQYPRQKNLALRVLEPLCAVADAEPANMSHHEGSDMSAPEDVTAQLTLTGEAQQGVAISFKAVSVRALGQTILEPFDLTLEPGAHVCIVGPSGAGKSTLLSLLLGWHQPATGAVRVDGLPLEGAHLEWVRTRTAWVDPQIQIWNRALLDNLLYGVSDDGGAIPVGEVLESADLRSVVQKLPDGLQSRLGESGASVSGGEGQRVRFGRALLRRSPRLVILDEPFGALDREQRRQFLRRARGVWRNATLLLITHDVAESRNFERVLVVEKGRIVEDGRPADLVLRNDSRYRALLQAERAVEVGVWASRVWRKLHLEKGRVVDKRATREYEHRFDEDLLAGGAPGRGSGNLKPQDSAPAQIH